MFKFMILFHHPDSLDNFENSYNDLLALVERMPEIKRRQVVTVVGSPTGESPFYRILEVYFENRQQMEEALVSPAGQEAGGQLATFPAGSFQMAFAEVYEEDGGHTPASKQTGADSNADA
jgi:uncharacterized protein (TIGR02118 family)